MDTWMEDRQHDWLAEEMQLEGITRKTAAASRLKAEHIASEHRPADRWDSGAVSLKNEHQRNHQSIHRGTERIPQKKSSNPLGTVILVIFLIFWFFGFFFGALD